MQPAFESGNLPPIPTGAQDVRHSNMVDTDFVQGMTFISSERTVVDGTNALLTGGTGAGWQAAWAEYAIIARPQVPTMVIVTAEYLDAAPMDATKHEGYWVAVADYAKGTWRWLGSFKQLSARIPIPGSVDAVSPGGNVYCVVACDRGMQSRVVQVQVGYDVGVGYEDYTLAAPIGDVAGIHPDIQVTPAGAPYIAYMHTEALFLDDRGKVRIAHWGGSSWVREDVATPYYVSSLRFALGDGGRRALLVQDEDTDDLHLLLDDGSGVFATDLMIEAAMTQDFLGSVIFINGTDNAAGPLDTVLCTFVDPVAPPKYKAKYYRLTFGNPGVAGDILPAAIQLPDQMILSRTDSKTALVAVPDSPVPPTWTMSFGEYSAVADAWNFAIAPAWNPAAVDDGDHNVAAVVHRLPGGVLAAGLIEDNGSAMQFGLDSAVWNVDPINRIPAGVDRYLLDIERYSDGRLGFVASYGTSSPMLISGTVGNASPWQKRYLNNSPWSGKEASLAIGPDDTAYVAAQDAIRGSLRYYRITPSNVSSAEIDKGALGHGLSIGMCPLAYADGRLYAFYTDLAHMRLCRAVNENGVWLEEGTPLGNQQGAYIVTGAGYLQPSGLLYAVYMNYLDMSYWVASGKPDDDPEDWVLRKLAGYPQEYVMATDNGVDIAALPYVISAGNASVGFTVGHPRSESFQLETITTNTELIEAPYGLAYNAVNGRWGFVSKDDNANYIYYFERVSPGVWTGPTIVASELGATAEIMNVGLSFTTAGLPRVVVAQKADASPIWKVNVYAGTDVPSFSLLSTVCSIDTTTDDIGNVSMVAGPGGEPIICVPHDTLPVITYDMTLYYPQGGGVWAIQDTWFSPLTEFTSNGFGVNLCVTPQGVAQSVALGTSTPATFGRIALHYPW